LEIEVPHHDVAGECVGVLENVSAYQMMCCRTSEVAISGGMLCSRGIFCTEFGKGDADHDNKQVAVPCL